MCLFWMTTDTSTNGDAFTRSLPLDRNGKLVTVSDPVPVGKKPDPKPGGKQPEGGC